jgi:hypothetical protein
MANQPTGPLTPNRYPNTRPSAFEPGATLPDPNGAEAHKLDAEGNRLGAPVPNPNAEASKSVPVEPSPIASLVLRYPTHFSPERIAAAKREQGFEVTPPPGVDPNHPDLAVFGDRRIQ